MSKLFRLFTICLLVLTVAISGCSDDGDDGDNGPQGGNDDPGVAATVTSSIDNSVNYTWNEATSTATFTNGILTVLSTSTEGYILQLSVTTASPGTFTLGNAGVVATFTENASLPTLTFSAPVGTGNTIQVTEFSTANMEVSGSFNIKLQQPLAGGQRDISGTFNDLVYN